MLTCSIVDKLYVIGIEWWQSMKVVDNLFEDVDNACKGMCLHHIITGKLNCVIVYTLLLTVTVFGTQPLTGQCLQSGVW